MKKPRKPRGTMRARVAPVVAFLVLLVANGQAFIVTVQPACN